MNWGNRLLITFIVFGAGIFYLVYRSMNTNFELVEKDYYKNELAYQQIIDASKRTDALQSPVQLKQLEKNIVLQLPDEMKNKSVTGEILFYCDYDETKDKKFLLKVNENGEMVFHQGIVARGNYTVKINWSNDGKDYYTEKKLTVN